MSSIARPTGHLPKGVYWRRRFVLIAIVLLIIWGVTRLLPGGDGDPTGAAGDSPSTSAPTSDPTPEPTATPSTAETTKPPERKRSKKVVTVPVTLEAATGTCQIDEVRVEPSVGSGAYTESAVPIVLAFSTTGEKACSLDLGSARLLVGVATEDSSVWDTRTCKVDPAPSKIQLDPSWSTRTVLTWSGRRAGEECKGGASFAPAGDYTVRAALIGGEPQQSSFALSERPKPKPAPKPTPSRSPEPKPKKSG